jgi:hypothetical protein
MGTFKLLSVSNDAKTVKGEAVGFLTGILYMAPYTLSGHNVCPMASPGCIAGCLNTAGRASFTPGIHEARKRKTQWYFKDRLGFMQQLVRDICSLERKAKRLGLKPVVRLNGTSDIIWERVPVILADGWLNQNIMSLFPHVTFYDYTKHLATKRPNLPKNYSLTFSLDERPESMTRAEDALAMGWNVSVVFRKEIPETYLGRPVVIGDETDLRFLDAPGVWVGLKAKGKAKKDTSGFVRD